MFVSLTANGRTDRRTNGQRDSRINYSSHMRVVQSPKCILKGNQFRDARTNRRTHIGLRTACGSTISLGNENTAKHV